MPKERARWEQEQTRLLLELALKEKEKFNFNHFGVTRDGWRNIYPFFPQFKPKQVTNKLEYLRQQYKAWKEAQSASGLGRDTQTGGIEAEPDYWLPQDGSLPAADDNTQGAEPSSAGAARVKPPQFLDELEALFGDRNRNTGIYMSGGGIGTSTPPHSGPSSFHSGSKRRSGDQVVDSPRKKACEYLERISESIAVRTKSRDRERTREQEEVDEAMQILQDDGVPIPSDMYFTALELLKNSVSRREFLNMEDPQVRKAWLTWQMRRNQY